MLEPGLAAVGHLHLQAQQHRGQAVAMDQPVAVQGRVAQQQRAVAHSLHAEHVAASTSAVQLLQTCQLAAPAAARCR